MAYAKLLTAVATSIATLLVVLLAFFALALVRCDSASHVYRVGSFSLQTQCSR